MLFQVLCGFEPIFYTTHPNEESNILSTGGVVSKLVFSNNGDDTGIIKYSINDKIVYAKKSED